MDKAIENKIDQLQQEFLEAPHTNCDASEAEAMKQLILNMGLATAGLTEGDEDFDKIMAETEERLRNPQNLGPECVVAEVVFRRMAVNLTDGYSYLDRTINAKNAAQSDRASKPRPKSKDKITDEIEEVLSGNPKLSAKAVGQALETCGKITLIEEEYHHSEDASRLKVSNLRSRVTDAKKRLQKDSG